MCARWSTSVATNHDSDDSAGFSYFTDAERFRTYVQREVLALEVV